MEKLSGLVLDIYDDPKGDILKSVFPTLESVPGLVKEAHQLTQEDRDRLPDDAFALILEQGGSELKKFATVDAGNTALSVEYFLKTGHKLPVEAQKVAAHNLCVACGWFGIEPPEELQKVAQGRGLQLGKPEGGRGLGPGKGKGPFRGTGEGPGTGKCKKAETKTADALSRAIARGEITAAEAARRIRTPAGMQVTDAAEALYPRRRGRLHPQHVSAEGPAGRAFRRADVANLRAIRAANAPAAPQGQSFNIRAHKLMRQLEQDQARLRSLFGSAPSSAAAAPPVGSGAAPAASAAKATRVPKAQGLQLGKLVPRTALGRAAAAGGLASLGYGLYQAARQSPTKTAMAKQAIGVMPMAVGAMVLPSAVSQSKKNLQAARGAGGGVVTPQQMKLQRQRMGLV